MLERIRVGPLGVNCYVIKAEGAVIVVDPGDEPGPALSFLGSNGLVPSLIVATHGHLDHIAAIPALIAAFRPNGLEIPVAAHKDDAPYFGERGERSNGELFALIGFSSYFEARWSPMPELSILLSEGDAIPGTSLTVLHTPGHSAGSICLHDEAARLLVSGDTLFRSGVGRTDGPDSDQAALEASLGRLLDLPEDTRVLPGHGPETTIGRERKSLR